MTTIIASWHIVYYSDPQIQWRILKKCSDETLMAAYGGICYSEDYHWTFKYRSVEDQYQGLLMCSIHVRLLDLTLLKNLRWVLTFKQKISQCTAIAHAYVVKVSFSFCGMLHCPGLSMHHLRPIIMVHYGDAHGMILQTALKQDTLCMAWCSCNRNVEGVEGQKVWRWKRVPGFAVLDCRMAAKDGRLGND